MEMSKKTNILLAVIAVILGIGVFQTHSMKIDLDLSEHNNNTITVTGTAEQQTAADTASISFYVTKKGTDQSTVANYVNTNTKTVVDVIKGLGIDTKDIKTTNYSINPEYSWDDGQRNFTGYRAQQSVSVIIRDLEQVPEVLAKVVEQNVDSLNGPNFYIDKLDDLKDNLRAEAIKDAKKKANELADELGVDVDKIVGFSEDTFNGGYAPMAKMTMAMSEMDNMGGGIVEPEINVGEEKITKTVTITFKIEN
jgi:uncharacterized protein YggE